MTLIAEEVKATVRTIVNDAGNINQFFWQAAVLPKDIPKVLGTIEDNFRATFAPGSRHPIYVKYGTAGTNYLRSCIKTNGHSFKHDMKTLIEQTKRDRPNEPITVIVLIYATKHARQDNWEQNALVNALRDDLPSRDLRAMNERLESRRREMFQLSEQLKAKQNEVDWWHERTLTRDRRISELKDTLLEKDQQIASLGRGIANPELDRLKEEIRKQRETIRKHEDTIQQRNDAIKKHGDDFEELQNRLEKANLKNQYLENGIAEMEDEVSAMKDEVSGMKDHQQTRTLEVGGLEERLRSHEQEVANLQATIQDQNEAIASAKEREEGLRYKLKGLLEEKYIRERENLERQKKEMEQEMARQRLEMERQRQEELESFGPR